MKPSSDWKKEWYSVTPASRQLWIASIQSDAVISERARILEILSRHGPTLSKLIGLIEKP